MKQLQTACSPRPLLTWSFRRSPRMWMPPVGFGYYWHNYSCYSRMLDGTSPLSNGTLLSFSRSFFLIQPSSFQVSYGGPCTTNSPPAIIYDSITVRTLWQATLCKPRADLYSLSCLSRREDPSGGRAGGEARNALLQRRFSVSALPQLRLRWA